MTAITACESPEYEAYYRPNDAYDQDLNLNVAGIFPTRAETDFVLKYGIRKATFHQEFHHSSQYYFRPDGQREWIVEQVGENYDSTHYAYKNSGRLTTYRNYLNGPDVNTVQEIVFNYSSEGRLKSEKHRYTYDEEEIFECIVKHHWTGNTEHVVREVTRSADQTLVGQTDTIGYRINDANGRCLTWLGRDESFEQNFTYNDEGKLIRQQDIEVYSGEVMRDLHWTYDAENRLASEDFQLGPFLQKQSHRPEPYLIRYDYQDGEILGYSDIDTSITTLDEHELPALYQRGNTAIRIQYELY